jgi:hypothetical protein
LPIISSTRTPSTRPHGSGHLLSGSALKRLDSVDSLGYLTGSSSCLRLCGLWDDAIERARTEAERSAVNAH